MIGSLRGELLERWSDGEVLVEVAGVGYRVTVSPATSVDLGETGRRGLPAHPPSPTRGRRDALRLPGADERLAFEALLGAHGVGPSLALAILSVHPPAALQRVLAADDLAALCLVPGVGKKTAARLLVELKSRLDVPGLDAAAIAGTAGPAGVTDVASPQADVRDALANLGYGPDEVTTVLRDLPDDDDPSALLRVALQRLAVA